MLDLTRRRFTAAALSLLAGGCSGPRELATIKRGVLSFATASDKLCWVAGSQDGELAVVDVTGGTPLLLKEGLRWPRQLHVHGEELWIACEESIERVPLHGGPGRSYPADEAVRVCADGAHAYWLQSNGELWRRRRDGAAPQRLAPGPAWPSALAMDAEHVYWGPAVAGPLRSYRKRDGLMTELATAANGFSECLAAADALYWTTRRQIMRLRRGASAEVVCEAASPSNLVLLAEQLYWIEGGVGGAVARVMRAASKPGAVAQAVISGIQPQGLVIRDGAAFWPDRGRRALLRVSV